MRGEMDRIFEERFSKLGADPHFRNLLPAREIAPEIDLQDTGDRYSARVDLPGVDKSKIDVRIDDRTLTVSGRREKEAQDERSGQAVTRERSFRKFSRALTLPGPVRAGEVTAKYEGGVLTLSIPKAAESGESRKVPLQ